MILPQYTPVVAVAPSKKKIDIQKLFTNRIKSYMCPPPEICQMEENILNGIIINGGMGCGKTTVGNYLIKWAINKVIEMYGVDEGEIAYIYANSVPIKEASEYIRRHMDLSNKKYMYLFNDDAIAGRGQHSRLSQTKENVQTAQFYVNMRHQFKEAGMPRSCAIIPIHATQIYSHLDRVFRCTCYMTIFKDWPNETVEQQEIAEQVGRAAADMLRHITQVRKFSMDKMQRIKAMSSFIVKTVDPVCPVILVRPGKDEDPLKYRKIKCPVEPLSIQPQDILGISEEEEEAGRAAKAGDRASMRRKPG